MADGTVDLQILDDGAGVKYVFTPVNAGGSAVALPAGVVPSYNSNNPALTVVPDPSDTTGLTALGTISPPAQDAAGVVVTITAALPNGTVLTFAAPAVDIVPDPNNPANPTGFTVVESAL